MTLLRAMSAVPPPPSVPCSGCGKPVPYDPGEDGCYAELLMTPLGRTYARTCRKRSCVQASRDRLQGRPCKDPKTTRERIEEHR